MKMASLFDGSGGFPLAASMCGIEPVWASEVEPYPIAVTRQRFPHMKHMGDVSKIRGGEVPPVDIITFGSPCQDMSIAGKRAGIQHEANGDDETTRSGLFMEAARIIEEMREATNGRYPRYAVWENVPGAFSSNKGEDFRLVLQTLIQIVEPTAVVPPVPKAGWSYYDCWMGDGWSIAYRTVDAQYWGVPQRRRRIYLVVDFAGQRAGEILFERESLRGYSAESGTARKGAATDVMGSAGVCDIECLTPWDVQSRRVFTAYGAWPALYAGEGGGHGYVCYPSYCLQGNTIDRNAQQNGSGICEDVAFTLNAVDRHGVVAAWFKGRQGADSGSVGFEVEKSPTLVSGMTTDVVYVAFAQNQRDELRDLHGVAGALAAEPGMKQQTFLALAYDARVNGDGRTASTITGDHENRVTDYTTVVCMATQQGGAEIAENLCPTITAAAGMSGNNQPVLCMAHGQANAEVCENLSPCLNCNHEQPIVVSGMDCRNGELNGDLCGTLQAKPGGGFSYNCTHPVLLKYPVRYIVRRLTPIECARLQGFPDRWGDVPAEDSLDDMEDLFWLWVRQTYDAINGRPVKDYTTKQILSWYNKLHTDSAEYKMWGNGIALPCALYVMEGITEAAVKDFFGV